MESHEGFDYCSGSRFSTIFVWNFSAPKKWGKKLQKRFEELLV